MKKAIMIVVDDKREELEAAKAELVSAGLYNATLVDDLANALDFARYAEMRAELAYADNRRLRCIIALLLAAYHAKREQPQSITAMVKLDADELPRALGDGIDHIDDRPAHWTCCPR